MLPIRQQLNQLPGLNRTHKAVLIEVCELAENGGKGACTATNGYLATRLAASERTVSRTVVDLEGLGFLDSTGMGKGRTLRPSSVLRGCYVGDKSECATNLANLATHLGQPSQSVAVGEVANLDNQGGQPRQSGSANLDTLGSQPSQNGSRVYRDDQNDQLKTTIDDQKEELASLRAALTSAQSDLALMTADRDRLAEEVTTLKAQSRGLRTPGAAEVDLTFPDWATDTFRAEWQQWVAFRQGKRDKLKPASLQKMLDKLAAYDEEFSSKLFDKAITNGYTGLIYEDTDRKFAEHLAAKPENAHLNLNRHAASTRNNGFNSIVRGQKPDARAGQMASALASSVFGANADRSELPF